MVFSSFYVHTKEVKMFKFTSLVAIVVIQGG